MPTVRHPLSIFGWFFLAESLSWIISNFKFTSELAQTCFVFPPSPPKKFVVTEQSHQDEAKFQINSILQSLDNSIKDQNTSVKNFLFTTHFHCQPQHYNQNSVINISTISSFQFLALSFSLAKIQSLKKIGWNYNKKCKMKPICLVHPASFARKVLPLWASVNDQ